MKMVTTSISNSSAARDRTARNLPVPHPNGAYEKADMDTVAAPAPRRGRSASRHETTALRPRSAFLAQLSLQYDDIRVARRARRERAAAAAASYADAIQRPYAFRRESVHRIKTWG